MKKYLVLLLFASMILTANAQQSERAGILESLEQNNQNKPQQSQDQQVTATLKSASRLFGEKDDLTTVIMIIPAGSSVIVLDSDSTYFHVKFEDTEGFINKRSATLDKPQTDNNNQLNEPRYQEKEETDLPQIQESTENQPEEISRFSYLENKYGSSVAARINSGKIWKGMSPEMVTDSWGNPQKINRVINGNVIKEEWIYKNTWLYFQNNKLIEWGRK
jgi:hypothetical protein